MPASDMRDGQEFRRRLTPAEDLIAKTVTEELRTYAMRQALKRTANTLGVSLSRVISAYANARNISNSDVARKAGLDA